jgi:transaldolase
LKATKALSARGIRVNVTLVFSPLQGLAAAKCGATYVSPFVGRLDDLGHDGFAMVEQLVRILRNYAYPSQVLVASLRSPNHVLRAAETGAQVATVPFNVMRQMLEHPLTAIGLERFLADWHKTKQKI